MGLNLYKHRTTYSESDTGQCSKLQCLVQLQRKKTSTSERRPQRQNRDTWRHCSRVCRQRECKSRSMSQCGVAGGKLRDTIAFEMRALGWAAFCRPPSCWEIKRGWHSRYRHTREQQCRVSQSCRSGSRSPVPIFFHCSCTSHGLLCNYHHPIKVVECTPLEMSCVGLITATQFTSGTLYYYYGQNHLTKCRDGTMKY